MRGIDGIDSKYQLENAAHKKHFHAFSKEQKEVVIVESCFDRCFLLVAASSENDPDSLLSRQTKQCEQKPKPGGLHVCLRAEYATTVPSSSFSIFRCIELLLKAHISLKAPFPLPTSWCKFKVLMTFEIRNRNGAFESLHGKTLLRKWSVEMPFKPVPSTMVDH